MKHRRYGCVLLHGNSTETSLFNASSSALTGFEIHHHCFLFVWIDEWCCDDDGIERRLRSHSGRIAESRYRCGLEDGGNYECP